MAEPLSKTQVLQQRCEQQRQQLSAQITHIEHRLARLDGWLATISQWLVVPRKLVRLAGGWSTIWQGLLWLGVWRGRKR